MKAEVFESKPRWPGAPPICLHTNLPAFDSMDDYGKFEKKNMPGAKALIKWNCSKCGKVHVWTIGASDPAGASSGTGRSSKLSQSENYLKHIYRKLSLRQKPAET
jgi:hypothetical protein